MRTVTKETEFGATIIEECDRREFLDFAEELIDYAKHDCNPCDTTMTIRYKDGSTCYVSDYYGIDGRFRKTNIVFGVIDNGSTQQVFGRYVVDEYGVVDENREPVYKVYKGYKGKRCIKKFDDLIEAQMWCWSKDKEEPYRIEWQYPDEATPRHMFL